MSPNQSIGGIALTLGAVTYTNGYGVNSFSGIEFDLGGVASTVPGHHRDRRGRRANGSVDFQVFADGMQMLRQRRHDGHGPRRRSNVDLDVTGVSRLVLGLGRRR